MATETSTISASAVCLAGLVTPTEFYTFANLTSPDNATQIAAAILDATERIMSETDRWFVQADNALTITEQFSGNNANAYFPKQGPILSVGTITLWNGTTFEEIDTDQYDPVTDGNKIYFRMGNVFAAGNENWKVIYTFGYKGTVPRDLKRACMLLTKHAVDHAERSSALTAQSDGEQSFQYSSDPSKPPNIEDILSRYRRFETIG